MKIEIEELKKAREIIRKTSIPDPIFLTGKCTCEHRHCGICGEQVQRTDDLHRSTFYHQSCLRCDSVLDVLFSPLEMFVGTVASNKEIKDFLIRRMSQLEQRGDIELDKDFEVKISPQGNIEIVYSGIDLCISVEMGKEIKIN